MQDPAANISPLILQKLGLDSQTVQKIQNEKALREQSAAIAKKNGFDTFNALYQDPQNPIASIHLANGTFDISPVHAPGQLLEAVRERLKILESSASPDLIPQVRSFIEGYGMSALEKKDYKTAISCLDYSSKAGIINNEDAIAKIKFVTLNDPEELVKVAEIIESLKEVIPTTRVENNDFSLPSTDIQNHPDTKNNQEDFSEDEQSLRPVPPQATQDHQLF